MSSLAVARGGSVSWTDSLTNPCYHMQCNGPTTLKAKDSNPNTKNRITQAESTDRKDPHYHERAFHHHAQKKDLRWITQKGSLRLFRSLLLGASCSRCFVDCSPNLHRSHVRNLCTYAVAHDPWRGAVSRARNSTTPLHHHMPLASRQLGSLPWRRRSQAISYAASSLIDRASR